ncbi:hypothetical protein ACSBL2_24950 [Pedobacter sp. AW31-3R]|uniref:hypothetical protein n=1 Tax=Pedobacter sp. AW31-3R TaxID=3445781 RepID=UPI003FA03832
MIRDNFGWNILSHLGTFEGVAPIYRYHHSKYARLYTNNFAELGYSPSLITTAQFSSADISPAMIPLSPTPVKNLFLYPMAVNRTLVVLSLKRI